MKEAFSGRLFNYKSYKFAIITDTVLSMKEKLFCYILFLGLVFSSCSLDFQDQPSGSITKKTEDGGIQTIQYPAQFGNKDAYQLYNKGLRYVRKEDYEEAQKLFAKALILDPTNVIILNSLGLSEKRLYNYDQAAVYFKTAMALDSTYLKANINLGLNYYYNEKYKEAIEVLKSVKPDQLNKIDIASLYYHLFMNYTALEDCDKAMENYDLARSVGTNQLFLENLEKFKNEVFIKNCGY